MKMTRPIDLSAASNSMIIIKIKQFIMGGFNCIHFYDAYLWCHLNKKAKNFKYYHLPRHILLYLDKKYQEQKTLALTFANQYAPSFNSQMKNDKAMLYFTCV